MTKARPKDRKIRRKFRLFFWFDGFDGLGDLLLREVIWDDKLRFSSLQSNKSCWLRCGAPCFPTFFLVQDKLRGSSRWEREKRPQVENNWFQWLAHLTIAFRRRKSRFLCQLVRIFLIKSNTDPHLRQPPIRTSPPQYSRCLLGVRRTWRRPSVKPSKSFWRRRILAKIPCTSMTLIRIPSWCVEGNTATVRNTDITFGVILHSSARELSLFQHVSLILQMKKNVGVQRRALDNSSKVGLRDQKILFYSLKLSCEIVTIPISREKFTKFVYRVHLILTIPISREKFAEFVDRVQLIFNHPNFTKKNSPNA